MSAYLDQSEFRETLRKIIAGSTRELPLELNSRLLAIAKTAKELTPISSREKIESALGVSGYELNYTKKGDRLKKNSRGAAMFSNGGARIYAIVNYWREKKGEPALHGAEMRSEEQKFLTRRFRAVGSLKSGWTRAIGILAAAVKGGIGDSGGPRVKMASQATPARDGWNPVASLEYRVTVDHGGGREVEPSVISATESAFAREQSEMEAHLENRLREVAQKAGAL